MGKGRQRNRMPGVRLALLLALAQLMLGLATLARAGAPSALDGFDPSMNGSVLALAVQPDGKILLGGNFTPFNSTVRKAIVRLNHDGTLDTTFDFVAGQNTWIERIALQADGKILAVGNFTTSFSAESREIVRLNTDGSLDPTFHPYLDEYGYLHTVAVQADGKVLLGGNFTSVNGKARRNFARLNADGSLDDNFDVSPYTYYGDVHDIAVQDDGKVLLGGFFCIVNATETWGILRLNADGSVDRSFNPVGVSYRVYALAVQADGKVLAGGGFTQVKGVARNRIARLNSNGSLDVTFDPGTGADREVNDLALQPDGKILLCGWFTIYNGLSCNNFARLNVNGSLDATFIAGPGTDFIANALALQPDGKVLVGGSFSTINGIARKGIARVNTDGTVETTLDARARGAVYALGEQPDGRMLLGGFFSSINSIAYTGIARLNAGGLLDMTFGPSPGTGSGTNDKVYALAMQADGKTLLGGTFTSVHGVERKGIARLNADGTVDMTFNPGTGANGGVTALAIQADGKVLLSGAFTTINGVKRNHIARLNTGGSLDTTFAGVDVNSDVMTLAILPDGKILLGGSFTNINGTLRNRIARLNADGSLDAAFDPGTGADSDVLALRVQPDGKVILGGQFNSINGTARQRIARLNADGSLDITFTPGAGASDTVYSLGLQADGKVLLAGNFVSFNDTPRRRIARLNADGSLDTTFDPGAGANSEIRGLTVLTDGKILLGGWFSSIGGIPRNYLARLTNTSSARQSLTVTPGGGEVTWKLAGSYPYPGQVLFEESADGATWNKLGWGEAMPGVGYRLRGLHLPMRTNRYLRATGWVTGGLSNGSVSLCRSVLRFYLGPNNMGVGEWTVYE